MISITGNNTATFAIRQVGGASCSYVLSRASEYFTVNGGSDSLTVTTQTGCAWSVTNPASWVTITAGSSGSGNGTVSYTVAVNNSASPRFVNLTIGGQTFTINQDVV